MRHIQLTMMFSFFASAACAYAQVCVNIILNSVASAMDLTAYAPKWLNIRRGYDLHTSCKFGKADDCCLERTSSLR